MSDPMELQVAADYLDEGGFDAPAKLLREVAIEVEARLERERREAEAKEREWEYRMAAYKAEQEYAQRRIEETRTVTYDAEGNVSVTAERPLTSYSFYGYTRGERLIRLKPNAEELAESERRKEAYRVEQEEFARFKAENEAKAEAERARRESLGFFGRLKEDWSKP